MRCALYLRVSTEIQVEEGYSLDAQLSRLRAFCVAQDWSVSDVYIDEAISAKDINRPRLQALLRDMEGHAFDVVLVYKLDRLTRSVVDLHALLQVFERYDVGFRSVTEVFDTTSAIGRLFVTIVAALAQWERENLGERVKFGLQELTRQGRWSGGRTPFGYTLSDGLLTPSEPAASLIREIFKRYISGQGTSVILKWLNNPASPQIAPNKRWSQWGLKYVLWNPLYAGFVRFGYKDEKGHKQKNPIIAKGLHEAIISLEVWGQAEKAHEERTTFPGRIGTGTFVLTGILRCGLCGSTMVGNTHYRSKKSESIASRYYQCTEQAQSQLCKLPRVRTKVVEAAVLEELERRYERLSAEAIQIHTPKQENPSERQITIMRGQIARIATRRKRWMDAYELGDITSPELRERLAQLTLEEAALQSGLQDMMEVQTDPDPSYLLQLLSSVSNAWDMADVDEKKILIRALVSRIEVYPGPEVSITFAE